jgi:hypothetical protein
LIIGPNRIHYWRIPVWREAFSDAQAYLPIGIRKREKCISFEACSLDRRDVYPWNSELATISISGSYMTEVIFFSDASRSLILTALIETSSRVSWDPLRWILE